MILGTAGHIDHGKTTLVKALTGVDTDRLPEEKRRGITIDLGFAPLHLPDAGTLGIVDVPGHEAFVRTMLAGATGIDLALLVVAADEGVMPQTREHLAILSILGVRGGVVALTKTDLVDEEWLALVRDDVRAVLAGSPLADAPILAVSAAAGTGLDALRTAIATTAASVPARDAGDLFRMPIDRAFTVRGTGTVVTGTVWTGVVAADATLRVLPLERPARVRGIQSHGASLARALPGTRVAIALAGVERHEVERGCWLVDDARWTTTRVLRADVALLDGAPPLGPRARLRFHLGTQETGARVVARGGPIVPGETRGVRIALDEPVLARGGDRFVLRAASPPATLGGGVVADAQPPGRRVRPWPASLGVEDRLLAAIDEGGTAGIAQGTLAVRIGLAPRDLPTALDRLDGRVARIGDILVASAVLDATRARILAAVDNWHHQHPLEAGAPLALVRGVAAAGEQRVAETLLRALAAEGDLEVDGAVARRRGWSPSLAGERSELATAVMGILRSAGAEPPSVSELEAITEREVRSVLRFLERSGQVVAVSDDRYYAREAVDELVGTLRRGMLPERPYAPAELRELLGFSRKYLIPFLEYCDRVGITARRASGRVRSGT